MSAQEQVRQSHVPSPSPLSPSSLGSMLGEWAAAELRTRPDILEERYVGGSFEVPEVEIGRS
jgi:hypothetical protein